jgi:uncharacterized protein (TIGR02284 family)
MTSKLDTDQASEVLNHLLARAFDAKEGYAVASEHCENKALSDWFKANADQRETFRMMLEKHLGDLDVDPTDHASALGKFHQAFMKLRAAVSSENDAILIAECLRGENQALEDYREAMKNTTLRRDAAKAIGDQAEYVKTQLIALDQIRESLLVS